MYKKAIEVLKIFNQHGYLAYIVGGYPRDFLLGVKTTDIDICTNAKPKEIIEIFDTESVSDISYGSIKVIYKKVKFDVTTFRKDIKYEDNRKPIKIKYVSELKKDLLRRDFTINTICIDMDENIIDLLDSKKDLDSKIIRTVGNPRYRIKEDALRILRAVRFASMLGFDIDDKTKYYIKKYGFLLKNLSSSRRKEELNKIFSSKNKEVGRKLILDLKLDKYLGLDNLREIVLCDDIIGIWSQLELSLDYQFSKIEKDSIKAVREMLDMDIDKYSIYKYGLYVSTVVGNIKDVSYKYINDIYNGLSIYSKKDINISAMDIANVLNSKPGNYLGKITQDIERLIVMGELENEYDKIVKYIVKNY